MERCKIADAEVEDRAFNGYIGDLIELYEAWKCIDGTDWLHLNAATPASWDTLRLANKNRVKWENVSMGRRRACWLMSGSASASSIIIKRRQFSFACPRLQ